MKTLEEYKDRALAGRVVYVVEYGSYSERYVAGVFTDRDAAAAFTRAGYGTLTEHEVTNELSPAAQRQLRPGERRYKVIMDRTGNEASAWESFAPVEDVLRHLWVQFYKGNPVWFTGDCWASDEEHAIKILNDRRTQWLAMGAHTGKAQLGGLWYEALNALEPGV